MAINSRNTMTDGFSLKCFRTVHDECKGKNGKCTCPCHKGMKTNG